MPATDLYNSERQTNDNLRPVQVKGATTIYAGSMYMLDANGLALPAAPAANCRIGGRASETVVNAGNDSSGIKVPGERGPWSFANSTVTPVTAAMISTVVWVEDDITVKGSAGVNPVKAGELIGFAPDGRPVIDLGKTAL